MFLTEVGDNNQHYSNNCFYSWREIKVNFIISLRSNYIMNLTIGNASYNETRPAVFKDFDTKLHDKNDEYNFCIIYRGSLEIPSF